MGVHADPQVPGQFGGLCHQIGGHLERRARGEDDPRHRPRARVVEEVDHPPGVLEDLVVRLDNRVRRQPALRLGRDSSTPARHESGRRPGPRLRFDRRPASRSARDSDGRRRWCSRSRPARRDRDGWRPAHDPASSSPISDRGWQPVEQTRILGARHYTGKRLIEVVMGVDQTGEDDMAAEVDHLVGLRRAARPSVPPARSSRRGRADPRPRSPRRPSSRAHRHDGRAGFPSAPKLTAVLESPAMTLRDDSMTRWGERLGRGVGPPRHRLPRREARNANRCTPSTAAPISSRPTQRNGWASCPLAALDRWAPGPDDLASILDLPTRWPGRSIVWWRRN